MAPQAEKRKNKKYELPLKALGAYKTDLIERRGRQTEGRPQTEIT